MTEDEEKRSKREDLQANINWSKWSIGFNEDHLEFRLRQLSEAQEEIRTLEKMITTEKEKLEKYQEQLKQLG